HARTGQGDRVPAANHVRAGHPARPGAGHSVGAPGLVRVPGARRPRSAGRPGRALDIRTRGAPPEAQWQPGAVLSRVERPTRHTAGNGADRGVWRGPNAGNRPHRPVLDVKREAPKGRKSGSSAPPPTSRAASSPITGASVMPLCGTTTYRPSTWGAQ